MSFPTPAGVRRPGPCLLSPGARVADVASGGARKEEALYPRPL